MATKKRQTKRKAKQPTSLVDRYLASPSMFERALTGAIPMPPAGRGISLAANVASSVARGTLTEIAKRMATKAAPATPVSPWVRRAQGGNLPTKDMTSSRAPRPDVYRGLADIGRAEPAIVQAAAAELSMMTKRAINEMNRGKVAKGEKPLDFPGNRGPGSRSPNKPKPRRAATQPKRSKPAARTGRGRARTQ